MKRVEKRGKGVRNREKKEGKKNSNIIKKKNYKMFKSEKN